MAAISRSRSGSRRGIVPRLLLLVVSVGFALGLGEIAIRAAEPRSDRQPLMRSVPGSGRLTGFLPNRTVLRNGVEIRTNSTGQRGPDYLVEKPAGTFRIIGLGDSYTFGTGVAFADTYLQILERQINDLLKRSGSEVRCEVINFGIEGYNTEQELSYLEEVGIAFRPDLVLLGYLFNDVEPKSTISGGAVGDATAAGPSRGATVGDATAAGPSRGATVGDAAAAGPSRGAVGDAPAAGPSHSATVGGGGISKAIVSIRQNSHLFNFLSPRVGALLRRTGLLKGTGATSAYANAFTDESPGWKRSRDALLAMKNLAAANNFQLEVVVFPAFVSLNRDAYPLLGYHRAVTEFCGSHGIPVLDLFPAFEGRPAFRYWVSPTDPHPNARATAIVADQILQSLKSNRLIPS